VILVDDRSSDGTAEAALRLGAGVADRRLEVVAGTQPPDGWVGKVWALAQGAERADGRGSRWLLLTDADIHHSPGSLRHLVAEAEARGLALDSRMARLRCQSAAERLLVPAFVLFFYLLFPPRWANRPRSRTVSAAGGCILLRRDALEAAGGFAAIRGELIDDLALARRVKRGLGLPTRIATSGSTVTSVRAYETIAGVWRMVRRSAFTQLRRSWTLLAGVLVAIAVMFVVPPLALAVGVGLAAARVGGAAAVWLAAAGLAAWLVMAAVALPAVRFFRLSSLWAVAMPLAGALYGGMTLDSALRGTSRAGGWR
jgi:hopene-associated glycosyltransferase HpnB